MLFDSNSLTTAAKKVIASQAQWHENHVPKNEADKIKVAAMVAEAMQALAVEESYDAPISIIQEVLKEVGVNLPSFTISKAMRDLGMYPTREKPFHWLLEGQLPTVVEGKIIPGSGPCVTAPQPMPNNA